MTHFLFALPANSIHPPSLHLPKGPICRVGFWVLSTRESFRWHSRTTIGFAFSHSRNLCTRRASFECTDGPKPFASGLMFSLLPPRQTVMGQWILCVVNEFGQCLEPSSFRYLEAYIWCLCDKMCGEGETHAVSSHGAWVKATEYRDARNFLMEWVIAHSLKS